VLIEARKLSKSFLIPSEVRRTIREHVFAGLRRRSFQRIQVLDGVDFELRSGETLGIMGRNGSGKTTLLKILCGIYRKDSGELAVRAPITPLLELGIGWNPDLDAVDNVLLMGTIMGMSLAEARQAVDEVLEFAQVERFANLELKHYSSGMASRLAYAVAFRAVREVLVIDEIFAVGDVGFKARCEARYRELAAAGHTTLLVSHDPRTIETFCSRALLLDGGRVVVEGTGSEVAAKYVELAHRATAA
jgi:ABC-type polysaccharide/polyol phosphate transport system ATPase subunit